MRSAKRKAVELPIELHQQLKQEAARQGLTTTMALVIAVREWLERQEKRREPARE